MGDQIGGREDLISTVEGTIVIRCTGRRASAGVCLHLQWGGGSFERGSDHNGPLRRRWIGPSWRRECVRGGNSGATTTMGIRTHR